MNLTYYNHLLGHSDLAEPDFDHLLLDGEVPTWPTTLQSIELVQLRKWEPETAETFFQSLIDSSGCLPHLRRLVIKAMLSIGWRDRSSFREGWVGSLERVFKRASLPPNPRWTSLGPFEAWKRREETSDRKVDADEEIIAISDSSADEESNTERERPSRRSRRLKEVASSSKHQSEQALSSPPRKNSATDVPSLRELATMRRMAREIEGLNDALSTPPPSSGSNRSFGYGNNDASSAQRREKGKGKAKAEVIQGMCDIVDITIDNQRPRENQFAEEDFLDSEPEGDDDWDGTADLPGGTNYAW